MAVMNKMRESMKTILMILVLAFIATIVFDWGMGGFRTRGRGGAPHGVIAQVNGEDISYDEFSRAYQQELKQQREQSGEELENYQLQQIENQVYERLIQQRLLSKVADRMKLSATDEEIGEELWNNPPEFIRQSPAFIDSTTGTFSMQLYQQALENPQLDRQWETVADYLRTVLPFQKLGDLINATPVVTDDDARIEYIKNNIKVRVNYLFFDASAFAGKENEPTEAEIKAYYEKHKEEYREKEKRVIDYVLFELKASPADSQAVWRQAQEILEDARSGRNFAEMASLYSQDPGSAKSGGDLGWFKHSAMVKPFADAAFAAKPGEIVGPVASQYGLHIIKVEDRRKADGEDEVKASHILLKIEPSTKTREAIRDDAAYLAETAKESGLKAAAEAEKRTVQTTPPFAAEGFIPGIGLEPRLGRFVFRAKLNEVSDVIYTESGYVVAQVTKIEKEHIPTLEQVRSRIVAALKAEQRTALAKANAEAAYSAYQSGTPLEVIAQQHNLTLQQTDEFTAGRAIPNVGREPAFAGTALSLNVGEVSQPVQGSRGWYIIQLVSKTAYDENDFQQQKESIKAQLAVRLRNQAFSQWYGNLKKEAKIKDYRSLYL